MGSKPFVVAGIPAYNEERSIARVIVKAMNYVDRVIVCELAIHFIFKENLEAPHLL